jgi:hypothetical protein
MGVCIWQRQHTTKKKGRRTNMGRIKGEDILAYYVGQEFICTDCITETERHALKLDDVITDTESEEEMLFCDRCKEQI